MPIEFIDGQRHGTAFSNVIKSILRRPDQGSYRHFLKSDTRYGNSHLLNYNRTLSNVNDNFVYGRSLVGFGASSASSSVKRIFIVPAYNNVNFSKGIGSKFESGQRGLDDGFSSRNSATKLAKIVPSVPNFSLLRNQQKGSVLPMRPMLPSKKRRGKNSNSDPSYKQSLSARNEILRSSKKKTLIRPAWRKKAKQMKTSKNKSIIIIKKLIAVSTTTVPPQPVQPPVECDAICIIVFADPAHFCIFHLIDALHAECLPP